MNQFDNLINWGLKATTINEYVSISEDLSDLYLARVINEQRGIYRLVTDKGELLGEAKGIMMRDALDYMDYPSVGDWVLVDRIDNRTGNAIIHKVLERHSMIKRRVAGNRFDTQIMASNIDIIFICMSLNNDFNLRRMERYLATVWDSNALPVIVLTKSDLINDYEDMLREVKAVAPGVDVIALSSYTMDNFDKIKEYITKSCTFAFIGSSGVGKSTLINRIIGHDVMAVKDLRNDDKGKHTTTNRYMFPIGDGNVLIDTPGIRAIQVQDIEKALHSTFADIEEYSKLCKFVDCKHVNEPGCAVQKAIDEGDLDEHRLISFNKLLREAKYYESKTSKERTYKSQGKKRMKQQAKFAKEIKKSKYAKT